MPEFIKPPAKPRNPPANLRRFNAIRYFDAQQQRQAAVASASSSNAATTTAADNRPQCPNKSCPKPNVVDDVCQTCGRVVDESNIVAEVQFGETASGAAVVQGTYVGADQGGARSTAMMLGGGRLMSGGIMGVADPNAARARSIRDARAMIQGYAHQLNLGPTVVDRAVNAFKLAHDFNFVQGRTMASVTAVCLYAMCRNETPCPIMLIDLADLVQVNVFKLGRTYKRLTETLILHPGNMPVHPEDLIFRFANKLEFGHETQRVAEDAVRLVRRMSRDWMVMGRRPSGICGACLVMAARMHNFRRSVREVVYIVKVTTHTIECRLREFRETESSHMSIEDFFSQDFLESSHDPPSFYTKSEEWQKKLAEQKAVRKRKRETRDDGDIQRDESENQTQAQVASGPKDKGKGKAPAEPPPTLPLSPPQGDTGTPTPGPLTPGGEAAATPPTATASSAPDMSSAPAVEYRRDADGFIIPPKPGMAEDGNSEYSLIAATEFSNGNSGTNTPPEVPSTSDDGAAQHSNDKQGGSTPRKRQPAKPLLPIDEAWEKDEEALEEEISEIMNDPLTMQHAKAYLAAVQRARVHKDWALDNLPARDISMDEEIREDEFANDPEVANCVLSSDEVAIKENIWNMYNRDWMRKQQEKMFRDKMEQNRPKQRRHRRKKPRIGEGQTSPASSAGEAAVAMLKRRGFSTRINYDAIRELLDGPGGAGSTRTSLAGSVFGDGDPTRADEGTDPDDELDDDEVENDGGEEEYFQEDEYDEQAQEDWDGDQDGYQDGYQEGETEDYGDNE